MAIREKKGLVIILAVLVIGTLAGAIYYIATRNDQSTDDAEINAHVITVSARVVGTVTAVHFTDNQPVHRGDLLVEIDPADYQVKRQAAGAELASAEAVLAATRDKLEVVQVQTGAVLTQSTAEAERSQSGYGASQAAVDQAQAAVAAAKARLGDATANERRAKALAAEGALPQQKLDEAETALATAQAIYAQTEATLAQTRASTAEAQAGIVAAHSRVQEAKSGPQAVAAAAADVARAQAAVDAAQSEIAAAELGLGYTRVVAPEDGIVAKRTVEPGQMVSPGQPLFSEIATQAVWVDANFKETQIDRMKPGEKAEISIDAFPDRSFKGTVESLAPATGARFSLLPPDNATGNFVKVVQRVPVRIHLDNPDLSLLRPGLSAEVTVDVASSGPPPAPSDLLPTSLPASSLPAAPRAASAAPASAAQPDPASTNGAR